MEDYSKFDKRQSDYNKVVLIDKKGNALRKEIKNKVNELLHDDNKRKRFLEDISINFYLSYS